MENPDVYVLQCSFILTGQFVISHLDSPSFPGSVPITLCLMDSKKAAEEKIPIVISDKFRDIYWFQPWWCSRPLMEISRLSLIFLFYYAVLKIHWDGYIYYRPQLSCEGYVFTGVCLSTGEGVYPSIPCRSHDQPAVYKQLHWCWLLVGVETAYR